jgi:hypothetical protein
MNARWPILALLTTVGAVPACGSDGAYAVMVMVTGSADALANYTVMAGPEEAYLVTGYDSAVVCTHDRQKFLNTSIPLLVEQKGAQIFSGTLERYACRLSQSPGDTEFDYLYLEDDGTLLHDLTPGDPRVWAACTGHWDCASNDL